MEALYDENPVMFKNNPLGFIIALVLCVVGIGFLILLVWHLKNKSSRLVVTRSDVLFEQGLLSKERSELNITSIRTVKVKQSFWNRIFGTGSIELYTAGDTAEIIATGMPDPNRVRDIIKAND
jgi:uncharacterized membrane protein YdbT with pleckstrin-like domain